MKLSDLSIRAKLFGSITILLITFVCAMSITFRELANLRFTAEELSKPQDSAILLNAELAHTRWVNSVAYYMLNQGDKPLDAATDGTKCGFGLWFYGPQRAELEKKLPAIIPIFDTIEPIHKQLHISALDIQKAVESGDFKKAQEIYDFTTVPILQNVQNELQRARQIAETHVTDIIASLNRDIVYTQRANYISLVIFVVLGLIMVAGLNFYITKPLHALEGFAARVGSGDFTPVVIKQKDEIGNLAASMNATATEVKRKIGFNQGIMDAIVVPMIVCDGEGRITFINHHLLAYWGKDCEAEKFYGEKTGVFFYNDPEHSTILDRVVESQTAIYAENLEVKNSMGEMRYMVNTCAPLWDLDHNPIGAVMLINDTTEISNQQERMAQINKRILSSAQEAQDISLEQSSAFAALNNQIRQTAQKAMEQDVASTQTVAIVHSMAQTLEDMAHTARETTANSHKTQEEARQGVEMVQNTVQCIHNVAEHSQLLEKEMHELDELANGINSVVVLIKDVADQTNLLALNAAIEAARAGEAGKGFAVVANEVRTLAEKTMMATKDVTSSILNLRASVTKSLNATSQTVSLTQQSTELAIVSGQKLETILEMARIAASDVERIAIATEEQSLAGQEISMAMESISRTSQATATSMQDSTNYVENLVTLSERVRSLIKSIHKDKRGSRRLPFKNPIPATLLSKKGSIPVELVNLSLEGLRVSSKNPTLIPEGEPLQVVCKTAPLNKLFDGITMEATWVDKTGSGFRFFDAFNLTIDELEKEIHHLMPAIPA